MNHITIVIPNEDKKFDFVKAKEKVMKNVKIDGDHWIYTKINKYDTTRLVDIGGKDLTPNLILLQCELEEVFPKGTRSKKICEENHCIRPEHWLLLNNENAYYKLGELNLLRNSVQSGSCRLWTGYINSTEYGCITYGGKTYNAHRFAMIVHLKKDIDDKLMVRHKCKNKTCISINCLELGTDIDNAKDKIRDGTNVAGEDCPIAKLTNEDVKNIMEQRDKKTVNELSK